MSTVASTRVDVYAGADSSSGLPAAHWLACGSLIAPDVVLLHGPGHIRADTAVVCVLSNDGGEIATGRVVAAVDGSATAVGLDAPVGRPVQAAQAPADSARSLTGWVETVAHQSGCSHRRPAGPDPDDECPDRATGRPWYCRLFPTLPACR